MNKISSNGWPIKALGQAVIVVNGGTPKTKVAKYWGGPVQWLTPKDMGRMAGREIEKTPRTITELGLANSSARLIPENSVILSTRAPIGHLAINTAPMAFNQGCRGLVPKEGLDPLFLYHFLCANRSILQELGTGTTFKELSANNLKSVPIVLPPLEEQRRIVAVLDEAFEGLDRACTHADRNIQDAQELLQSVVSDMITMSEWQEISLGSLCDILDRLRKPITKRDRISGPYPYYGATGVLDSVADYIFDEPLVLIGEDGAKWKAGENSAFAIDGKTWVNNHAHVIRPHRHKLIDSWLIYFLNAFDLMPFVSGMTVPKLNQGQLREIPIPLPSVEEQRRIIKTLNGVSENLSCVRNHAETTLADLDDLRQSLLQRAFAGELT